MNHKLPQTISPKELNQWLNEDSLKPILIDVRELEELSIAAFSEEVLHLPLSEFVSWSQSFTKTLSLDKPIVAICHSGVRSLNFGIWLLEQDGRYQVWNLQGGIDSWSLEVDNSVPRY
ncbi:MULTISPECIES: rhodanese-like domain-containing protein [Prochlorococcus]|uniref:Rhodanese-related sulfurtransferase n=1 Tax=Prochlorococcus marinus (strain SARG / CCMP1375 / SS120) TaxID=167539 RepID=Q7VE27_PROMA|nr:MULTISPECIES: rhodanese-like domain-containing protein [Prochlorococcus]AAP99233.1 Rhodanese-related sulfurtransferase [Prochlorococcus marinus subsp. marinus str. CCMP1375]KGG11498.1 Rhodanese-related sulfurtransferase [Prochlorococcus marinus str. LG]KGG18548.1 Rhodanese-related sulfurtransferase [Prochlorococcus marinus str. SS2]KGG22821.1 Rhodanese-related sulfurtransferase [Prochlorococcus marinus str. SS35]KGG32697.1 Rhodanese-related sulfurtransferase [Prochlorococcus marinus str. SS